MNAIIKKPFMFSLLILIIVLAGCGGGGGSEEQNSTTPNAPRVPSLVMRSNQISVIWQLVSGATGYEVWYHTANDPNAATLFSGDNNTSDTTCVITGLTNGTIYYIWVKAKNNNGTSGFSPVASGQPSEILAPPSGGEYHVDAARGDDLTGDGSLQNPWKTIKHSLEAMNGGETLIVHAGTYNEKEIKPKNGFENSRTTIKGAEGETMPIIDGGYRLDPSDRWRQYTESHPIFILSASQWVQLSNLDIRSGMKSNVYINNYASNINIEDCKFWGTLKSDCTGFILLEQGWFNVAVRRCYFEGWGPEDDRTEARDINIVGVFAFGGNGSLEVSNCEMNGTAKGIYHKHAGTGQIQEKIINNFIYRNSNIGIEVVNSNTLIKDNIVVGNAIGNRSGIAIYGGTGANDGDRNTIVHNTVYNSKESIFLRAADGDGADDNTIKDNIFYGYDNEHCEYTIWPWTSQWSTHGNISDYNLYWNMNGPKIIRCVSQFYTLEEWQTATQMDANSIQAVPVFVGGNNVLNDYPRVEDFQLTQSSPGYRAASDGLDMGADVSLVGIQNSPASLRGINY